MFEAALQFVRGASNFHEANRFGLWTLAAALVGGTIAQAAGLINFNLKEIILGALVELENNIEDTRSNEELAQDVMREFLTKNSRRICRWSGSTTDIGMPVDDPVARVFGNGVVAVHRSLLYSAWRDARVSRTSIKAWWDRAVIEIKTVRLAPGTAPVWAVFFRSEHIGMEIPDEQK